MVQHPVFAAAAAAARVVFEVSQSGCGSSRTAAGDSLRTYPTQGGSL